MHSVSSITLDYRWRQSLQYSTSAVEFVFFLGFGGCPPCVDPEAVWPAMWDGCLAQNSARWDSNSCGLCLFDWRHGTIEGYSFLSPIRLGVNASPHQLLHLHCWCPHPLRQMALGLYGFSKRNQVQKYDITHTNQQMVIPFLLG